MKLINFTGTKTSRGKYMLAILIPFAASWPIALLMYIILTTLGYSL